MKICLLTFFFCGQVDILLRYGNHPNIVTLYRVFEETVSHSVYLIMDYLKGG